MTQNVTTYFGLKIAVKSESDPATVDKLKELLRVQMANHKRAMPEGSEIYIKQLTISAADQHFTVKGIDNRLAHLGVSANITPSAKRGKKLKFVDLGCTANAAVTVKRTPDEIRYRLPGAYIKQHDQYCDYVAIIVQNGCAERDKQLSLRVHAQATPEYARRLKNIKDGSLITGLPFHLTKEIQFSLI